MRVQQRHVTNPCFKVMGFSQIEHYNNNRSRLNAPNFYRSFRIFSYIINSVLAETIYILVIDDRSPSLAL